MDSLEVSWGAAGAPNQTENCWFRNTRTYIEQQLQKETPGASGLSGSKEDPCCLPFQLGDQRVRDGRLGQHRPSPHLVHKPGGASRPLSVLEPKPGEEKEQLQGQQLFLLRAPPFHKPPLSAFLLPLLSVLIPVHGEEKLGTCHSVGCWEGPEQPFAFPWARLSEILPSAGGALCPGGCTSAPRQGSPCSPTVPMPGASLG